MSEAFHLTKISTNKKTGPIPVSTSSAKTCPSSCPFNNKNGCYADSGPLAIHWRKVTAGERGESFDRFCQDIKRLPGGQIWRHNQAGDLPGTDQRIDADMLAKLVKANRGKRGFTYTHKPVNARNRAAIRNANDNGFTINLSANNPTHADRLLEHGIAPVVAVVPMDAPKVSKTPAGNKVVICPAESSDRVTCATCQLCADPGRPYVIGFRAHGTQKRKADAIARSAEQ